MKNLKTLLLAIAVCALAAGCSHSSAPVYEPFSLDGAEPLEGTVLCDSIVASVVVDMMPVGDYLAVAYATPDNRCALFDRQGKRIAEFCPIGKGPGEALFIISVEPGERDGELWAYDPQSQKWLTFRLDSVLAGRRGAIAEESRDELADVPMNHVEDVRKIRDGLLFSGGNGIISPMRPERFVTTDRQGRITGRYGDVPYSDDTIEMKVAFMSAQWTISPDGTKMANGSLFGSILEIFDLTEGIRLKDRSYFIEPDFPHNEVGTITSYETLVFGFGSMTSTNDRIYAAYTGSTDPKGMKYIAVFDWNGRLKKLYKTDYRIRTLCVDPADERTLYAVMRDDDGEYCLFRYDLPE